MAAGPLRPDGLIGGGTPRTGAGLPALEGVLVALVVPADLLEAVAAELLEDGLGERDGHHGLAHHSRSGHRADIAPLHHGLHHFLRLDVHGLERAPERRDGLHDCAHDHGLAVGHAALEPTGAVGAPAEARVPVEEDLVVDLGAGAAGGLEAHAALGALDRVDGAE